MKKPIYIIVHGTNGRGYTDTTILKRQSIEEAIAYAKDAFVIDNSKIETEFYNHNNDSLISFFATDREDTTDRVSIFAVKEHDKNLVSIHANYTEYSVKSFNTEEEAKAALKKASDIITDTADFTDGVMKQGDIEKGEREGYNHFEIV